MKKYTKPVVANSYFAETLALFDNVNFGTEQFSIKIGIDQSDLDDPGSFFTLSQFRHVLQFARLNLGNMPLGIKFGLRLGIASHGFAGLAAVTQRNIGECVRAAEALISFRMPALAAKFVQSDEYFGLRFSEILPLDEDLPFWIEGIFASFLQIGRLQSGNSNPIHKLKFSHTEPKNSQLYYDVFGKNIEFCAPHCEYLIPMERYYQPTIICDPRNSSFYIQKLKEETPDTNKNTTAKDISRVFEEENNLSLSQSDMADKLEISGRNLRRRLSELNTSYQKLIGLYKKDKALAYLRYTKYSVTEISHRLGYADSSHFCRSFKAWIGCTPSEYRRRILDCTS